MAELTTGVSIISDNWLLQNAAEIIHVGDEAPEDAQWVSLGKSGELQHHSVPRTAIRFECLVSLIEQIVFCDDLYVMSGWLHTWENMSSDFKSLARSGIVKEFALADAEFSQYSSPYLEILAKNHHIADSYRHGLETLRLNKPNFDGQVVNGVLPYLGYADKSGLVYAPHPVRSRFLQRTLYKTSFNSDHYALNKLNELVNSTRVKYAKYVGLSGESVSLICRTPSIATLCLLESPGQISPLTTALELRDSEEFRQLRFTLHEFQKAIASQQTTTKDIDAIKMLESAISEVERRLKLRDFSEKDGFSELTTFFGLPLKVPGSLRAPIRSPKHTSAIYKLALTGKFSLRQVLKSSLGITSPLVHQGLLELAKADQEYDDKFRGC